VGHGDGPALRRGGHVLADRSSHARLRLEGEIDCAAAGEIAVHGLRLVIPGRTLLIDLRSVTFIDCSGLEAVAALCCEADRAGCPVELVGVSDWVSRVMRLGQFQSLLLRFSTVP
jgi:anti-anti-sigma factor